MDLQKSEELSRRFALLPIANRPDALIAAPVVNDTHALEVSEVPLGVAASHFQARPDILQFYRLLWGQGQSLEQQQFAHHATSILLVGLRNFDVLGQ